MEDVPRGRRNPDDEEGQRESRNRRNRDWGRVDQGGTGDEGVGGGGRGKERDEEELKSDRQKWWDSRELSASSP